MEVSTIGQGPFAALSFVAAPALLTNASSVLALSTINRMLRTRDSMRDLYAKSEAGVSDENDAHHLMEQVGRVERQASMLLRALHAIYVALASFASATLVTLLGAGLFSFETGFWPGVFAGIGVILGFAGAGGLVYGCWNLLAATHLSLGNIRSEAKAIRERQSKRSVAVIEATIKLG